MIALGKVFIGFAGVEMALGETTLSGLDTLGDRFSKSEKVSDHRNLDYLLGWNIGSVQVKKTEKIPAQYGSLYCSQMTEGQLKKAEKEKPNIVDDRNGNLMCSGLLM